LGDVLCETLKNFQEHQSLTNVHFDASLLLVASRLSMQISIVANATCKAKKHSHMIENQNNATCKEK
jgi:hypothetical protein